MRPLDRLAAGLLACGLLCVGAGLLPAAAASAAVTRIAPLLVFLGSVIVLAELTGRAGVFDAVATAVARLGRGRYGLLFVLCVAFASVTTAALNLDTTAVLLTPVMLSLADRVGLPQLPLAMTTVWLANTASLLLPVSNLTNLLAADRLGLAPREMAALMAAPQLAAVAATALCLWFFSWRPGAKALRDARPPRYVPPARPRPADPVLFRVCAAACAGFLVATLVADVPLWAASSGAALLVLAVFAVRDPAPLRPSLVPWRLLVLVPGLLLVVETVNAAGLHGLLAAVLDTGGASPGLSELLRTAGTGAVLSNALNNLPVYLAGEAALPAGAHEQLAALLIGTNAGPLVAPWASLATLLWWERCRRHGTTVRPLRFVLTGLVTAVAATTAATVVLAL
nr:SLC13 family permease [Streptomyces sp. HNM0574]